MSHERIDADAAAVRACLTSRRRGEMTLADDNAEWRRKRGLDRERQVPRYTQAEVPDPSRGGSRGYPINTRQQLLALDAAGVDLPSQYRSSIFRWKRRLIPYQMTGNKASQQMDGESRLILVFFKKVWPEATIDETIAFIADNSQSGVVYSRPVVGAALSDLGFTRKVASTTAYQAFTPLNRRKYEEFWTMPHPLGVLGTPRASLIDIDEFGVVWEQVNRGFGHALKGLRVRKIGKYGRGQIKVTVILAIEAGNPMLPAHAAGSLRRPRVWCRVYPNENTTTERYRSFLCDTVIGSFGPNEPQRTIMHDNLNSHKSESVVNGVYMAGHRISPRPPYQPHIAPVEYGIDQIACMIRSDCFKIHSINELVQRIPEYAARMSGIDRLFAKCGYQI